MKVLFLALNAKYSHTSLAIRYLEAACRCSIEDTVVLSSLELTINNHIYDIVNQVYDEGPDILAISSYIWNIEIVKTILPLIKQVLPNIIIIIGGPEASYESSQLMHRYPMIDFICRGEGEDSMPQLLQLIIKHSLELNLINLKLTQNPIRGIAYRDPNNAELIHESQAVTVSDINTIPFPYESETMEDLQDRIIYYESSRGCPYSCKYCLSCATKGVRYRNLNTVLRELEFFVSHNVRQVKFVDRTFNADKAHYLPILEFIAKQNCRTNFHFEIVAHRIDAELIEIMRHMPQGRVQFEIGIQSTNRQTLKTISRADTWAQLSNNIRSLMQFHNTHVHVDLIVGLPYEDLETFAHSFNDAYDLQADMLQVGFLKILKGTGMQEILEEYQYQYMQYAPYQIISNKFMDYHTLRKLQIFVDIVELFYNTGRFKATLSFLVEQAASPFDFYWQFQKYYYRKKLHLAPHSPANLYKIILDYIEDNYPELSAITKDLLKYDALTTADGKIRPQCLEWSQLSKEALDTFFKSPTITNYVGSYEFTSWRNLRKDFRIELFNYDIMKALAGKLVANEQPDAWIFSYDSKQKIAPEDFTLTITK